MTRFLARQLSITRKCSSQGGCVSAIRTDSGQAVTQSVQKVHSPRRKSISGYPAAPLMMMPSGQASTHSPQAVQPSTNTGSSIAPGGRTGAVVDTGSPLSKLRLLMSTVRITSNQGPGGPVNT